jgi:hypothetical protein
MESLGELGLSLLILGAVMSTAWDYREPMRKWLGL